MTVDHIKQAISELSTDERYSIAAWIVEQEYDDWDKEMARDFSAGGRGYQLVQEVKREVNEENFSSLEEGLQTRRSRS